MATGYGAEEFAVWRPRIDRGGYARDVTSTASATQTGSGLGASEATIPERRVGDALICGCSVAFDDPVPVATRGLLTSSVIWLSNEEHPGRRPTDGVAHQRIGPQRLQPGVRPAFRSPHPRITYGGSDAGNHRSPAQGDPTRSSTPTKDELDRKKVRACRTQVTPAAAASKLEHSARWVLHGIVHVRRPDAAVPPPELVAPEGVRSPASLRVIAAFHLGDEMFVREEHDT